MAGGGAHRCSYIREDTMLEKAVGLISRSSRSRYMLLRKRNFCSSVCMSVASPVRPTRTRSFIWKTFCMSQPIVWFLMPYRESLATAMQSLPAMAMTAAPLYCRAGGGGRGSERRRRRSGRFGGEGRAPA